MIDFLVLSSGILVAILIKEIVIARSFYMLKIEPKGKFEERREKRFDYLYY
ncbi:MAG: hypothetical protein WBD99_03805 [Thermodesulfobacteriota bacterium]